MTPRELRVLLLLVGVPVGLWQAKLGQRAIFVFHEGEPLLSWAAVVLGFMLTLPLVLLSWWFGRAAGIGLLTASVAATVAVVANPEGHSLLGLLWRTLCFITLPGCGLGWAALAIHRHGAIAAPES